jgi:hypothetical protein
MVHKLLALASNDEFHAAAPIEARRTSRSACATGSESCVLSPKVADQISFCLSIAKSSWSDLLDVEWVSGKGESVRLTD